jgi:predicted SAM-dependent methyltransferase
MAAPDGLIRLNLGCGLQTPRGWVNIDGSWNARLAKFPNLRRIAAAVHLLSSDKAAIPWSSNVFIHDIRKPLPFADGSVSAVFASHVLEHLYRVEAQQLIRESLRVLCSGGVLRLIVPDLQAIVEEYCTRRRQDQSPGDSQSPADVLNQRLLMRGPSPPKRNFLSRIYDSLNDFHSHKWMYDAQSLTALLLSAGFTDIQRKTSGDSLIENIAAVEDPSRILDGVCIEARKPALP